MQTNRAKFSYLLLAILVVGSALFYLASTAAIFDKFLNPDRARPLRSITRATTVFWSN
jgi:hypothetical protein